MTIYYDPEEYGLRLIGSMDWSDRYDGFDITAVWRDHAGRWLVGSDSGCSCPGEFDGQRVEDLVTFDTPQAALESIRTGREVDPDTQDGYAVLAELVMREADAGEKTVRCGEQGGCMRRVRVPVGTPDTDARCWQHRDETGVTL